MEACASASGTRSHLKISDPVVVPHVAVDSMTRHSPLIQPYHYPKQSSAGGASATHRPHSSLGATLHMSFSHHAHLLLQFPSIFIIIIFSAALRRVRLAASYIPQTNRRKTCQGGEFGYHVNFTNEPPQASGRSL